MPHGLWSIKLEIIDGLLHAKESSVQRPAYIVFSQRSEIPQVALSDAGAVCI